MLITEGYRRLNAELHQRPGVKFGRRGHRHAGAVRAIHRAFGGTILDYGCGRGDLARALRDLPVTGYDPAVAEFATLPGPADIVVCTDVLEHIEPDCLDDVLIHLRGLTGRIAYVVIATAPDTSKLLADGSNPHRIVRPPHWWRDELARYFTVALAGIGKRDCTFRCT